MYKSTTLQDTPIEIYTYSKTDKIKSQQLLNDMSDMHKAAEAFLVDLPVEHYTFLFHFEDKGAGAWEHSYSSEYVMPEMVYSSGYSAQIISIAAHEFFHVVTPLNIQSEIIEQFNFENPTPSQHLWLYEGTTEWASQLMQLRYGLTDLKTFLADVRQKIFVSTKYFDTNYSLKRLSMTSFSEEGNKQYPNIYMKGAVTATLLDILLLNLSDGKRGLRELIIELSEKYGKERSFPEDRFFEIVTEMTYPEVGEFFEKYVINAEQLPLKEYFLKIGIDYFDSKKVVRNDIGFSPTVKDNKIAIVKSE